MPSDPSETESGLTDLRRGLLRDLVLLVLLSSAAVLGITAWRAQVARANMAGTLLEKTSEKAEVMLSGFFSQVSRDLRVARDWARSGRLIEGDLTALNQRFLGFLHHTPQVSSVALGSEAGFGYLLQREKTGWLNRLTQFSDADSSHVMRRFERADGPVEEWEEQADYDPRTRPWFTGAMALENDDDVYWTEPYTFFTTQEPGITVASRWRPKGETAGPWRVLAFDVRLEDIAHFTTDLEVSERGSIVILDDEGRVIGLPQGEAHGSLEAIREQFLCHVTELNVPALTAACDVFERAGLVGKPLDGPVVLPFENDGEDWWVNVRRFDLGGRGLHVVAIVPESDLLASLSGQWVYLVMIGLLTLVSALGIGVVLNKRFRRNVDQAVSRARKLGQYTLEAKIGAGGMGAVYHARHSMLRRPTAVKLLKAEQAGSDVALGRFEREVQLTASLTHPNTIAIYDYGRTPDGVFYYAMEYVGGVSLERLVSLAGPLPPGRVIALLQQVCGSLEEAHSAGLVHRDIKPANIMVCRRGGFPDVVKVLDFGLVKHTDGSDDTDLALTQDGAIAGTPYYLPPETITRSSPTDGRSDLYAVGAVGYFLLTGERVFEGKTLGQLLAAQLNDAPIRPSERLGQELPRDLEDVILACLAKQPADRPQDAAELAERLGACTSAATWTRAAASAWWDVHEQALIPPTRDSAEPTGAAGPLTIDLQSR